MGLAQLAEALSLSVRLSMMINLIGLSIVVERR